MKRYKYHISVIVVTLIAFVALGASSDKDFGIGKNIRILINVIRSVNQMYVDEIDNDKLMVKAADAMLSSLDPYTEYLPEEEMEGFEFATTGKYGGLGSIIRKSPDGQYSQISERYKGFPIDKAGIRPGDIITAIDGRDLKGVPLDSVSAIMKGEAGSKISMTIKSLTDGTEKIYSLKRERIAIPAVPYSGYVSEGVGYIRLDNFSIGSADEVKAALINLKKTGDLKSVIIDLENNGGGVMDEAVNIVNLFVPKGVDVVSMKGKVTSEGKTYKTTKEPIDTEVKLFIMVNSSSASASEIVAGAVQDLDRGVVIGTRTFGKGLVQSTKEVGFGSFIKVTTAKYYIPSGRCIQALDYSHRNEDGSVGHIPDSLISEFKTVNGRKVYDGGGIMPDIKVDSIEYISRLTANLLRMGYVDDFAIDYFTKHSQSPDIVEFKLSDADFDDFCNFLSNKEIGDITSISQKRLDDLKRVSKQEKSYNSISDELSSIENKLKIDKEKSLKDNEKDIREYLEYSIISRYHYNAGRYERAVKHDKEINICIELTNDSDAYNDIIKNRDTVKK